MSIIFHKIINILRDCKSNSVWLIDIPCFNLTWHYANWHKNEEDVIDFLYTHAEEKSGCVCSTITTLTWMMRIKMLLNKAINQNMISAWSIHKTLMYPWYSPHYTKINGKTYNAWFWSLFIKYVMFFILIYENNIFLYEKNIVTLISSDIQNVFEQQQ